MARKNHLLRRISFHKNKLNGTNQMSLITNFQPNPAVQASAYSTEKNLEDPCLPNEVLSHIFLLLNAEELTRIAPVSRLWNALTFSDAVSYGIPFPSWLEDIDADIWKKLDLKKYGLDLSEVPRVNRRALTKALKPLSRKVEDKMGITNMVIPKDLTLNIVLQIAKDNSVPFGPIWHKVLINFKDIAVEQTRVLFFTNNIFANTRNHTPDQHTTDVTNIGKECGVTIQRPGVRDFMTFLVLSYLKAPENARTRLYPTGIYTRLLETVDASFLYGGFTLSGIRAGSDNVIAHKNIGVGVSGSSIDQGLLVEIPKQDL